MRRDANVVVVLDVVDVVLDVVDVVDVVLDVVDVVVDVVVVPPPPPPLAAAVEKFHCVETLIPTYSLPAESMNAPESMKM